LFQALHAYGYQCVEGWLQRGAAQWLAAAAPKAKRRSALRRQVRTLEQWMPLPAAASGGGGAALALLHLALRQAANEDSGLRQTAALGTTPLRERFDTAVLKLCGEGAGPDLAAVVAWAGGGALWSEQPSGLGSGGEFAQSIEMSRLGHGLEAQPFRRGDARTDVVGYAQGVFQGMRWLLQLAKRGNAGKIGKAQAEAFGGVWSGFCKSVQAEASWAGLVAWHAGVREAHKEEGYARWDENLRAHGQGALARLPPLAAPEWSG